MALHHIHDLSTKTALYRAVHDALPPGGALLNLDAAVTEGARLNELVFDRMAARMGDHGIPDAEARRHFAAWAKEDRYFSPPRIVAFCVDHLVAVTVGWTGSARVAGASVAVEELADRELRRSSQRRVSARRARVCSP